SRAHPGGRTMRTRLARVHLLLPAALGGLLTTPTPAAEPPDPRFAPYSPDADHPWNRLHQALFVREAKDGTRLIHTTDPLLYRGGAFLLVGEPHRRAVGLLDEFLARPDDRPIDDPLKRVFFQHDLWAAFDYAAWYPDDWVHKSQFEPAAIALRG